MNHKFFDKEIAATSSIISGIEVKTWVSLAPSMNVVAHMSVYHPGHSNRLPDEFRCSAGRVMGRGASVTWGARRGDWIVAEEVVADSDDPVAAGIEKATKYLQEQVDLLRLIAAGEYLTPRQREWLGDYLDSDACEAL